MLENIFTSSGASLLILLVQGLFAWALWSLRRVFVRNDEYLLHIQRANRRETALVRRLDALEEHLQQTPATHEMAALQKDLAALRGEILTLNMRISGLDRLLSRLEHGLDRQEERLCHLPRTSCHTGVQA